MTTPGLYAQILGSAFDELSPILKRIHDGRTPKLYSGRCEVARGQGWMVRLISHLARLPEPHSDVEVTIAIDGATSGEVWTRHFGGREMRSSLRNAAGMLQERLGPITFKFALSADTHRIDWRLREALLFGLLPLPRAWFKTCEARESIVEGRYHFDVRAELLGMGALVHYRGWLVEHEG
jgi:hypothetical protein